MRNYYRSAPAEQRIIRKAYRHSCKKEHHNSKENNMAQEESLKVVSKMMQDDAFSQWLGIEVLEIQEGYSRIQMKLRGQMLNGLGIIHGGIAFALADSAFAFACNNRNNLSVALDTSITFTKATHPG